MRAMTSIEAVAGAYYGVLPLEKLSAADIDVTVPLAVRRLWVSAKRNPEALHKLSAAADVQDIETLGGLDAAHEALLKQSKVLSAWDEGENIGLRMAIQVFMRR